MPGPSNAVVGDDAFGTQLPQSEVPQEDLTRERQMAAFSKSDEFQALKSVLEAKIKFYQGYLPGANGLSLSIQDLPNDERGWRWLAADTIINEFSSVLAAYEQANEAVRDDTTDGERA